MNYGLQTISIISVVIAVFPSQLGVYCITFYY